MYRVEVFCSNCGFQGAIDIDKGKSVRAKRCPKCGCRFLGKNPHVISGCMRFGKGQPFRNPWKVLDKVFEETFGCKCR